MLDQQTDNEVEHMQLEWDSSPEQYQLNSDAQVEIDFSLALEPKVLFPSDVASESLTSDTASEVFNDPNAPVPTNSAKSRLKRQNAFRRRKPNRKTMVDDTLITPRITRSLTSRSPVSRLGSMQRITRSSIGSISAPTTPG